MHVNQLKIKNASFYKINRGGDITYHGPGQIVCYPILDLENFFTDIHKYLRLLEETVINTLKIYEVEGERNDGKTGVWIDVKTPFPRKICAMGVRASRWITMHGFALNVNVNLDYFNNMNLTIDNLKIDQVDHVDSNVVNVFCLFDTGKGYYEGGLSADVAVRQEGGYILADSVKVNFVEDEDENEIEFSYDAKTLESKLEGFLDDVLNSSYSNTDERNLVQALR